MNSESFTAMSISPLFGPTRCESVGCDGGNFSFPKESCRAGFKGEAFRALLLISGALALIG